MTTQDISGLSISFLQHSKCLERGVNIKESNTWFLDFLSNEMSVVVLLDVLNMPGVEFHHIMAMNNIFSLSRNLSVFHHQPTLLPIVMKVLLDKYFERVPETHYYPIFKQQSARCLSAIFILISAKSNPPDYAPAYSSCLDQAVVALQATLSQSVGHLGDVLTVLLEVPVLQTNFAFELSPQVYGMLVQMICVSYQTISCSFSTSIQGSSSPLEIGGLLTACFPSLLVVCQCLKNWVTGHTPPNFHSRSSASDVIGVSGWMSIHDVVRPVQEGSASVLDACLGLQYTLTAMLLLPSCDADCRDKCLALLTLIIEIYGGLATCSSGRLCKLALTEQIVQSAIGPAVGLCKVTLGIADLWTVFSQLSDCETMRTTQVVFCETSCIVIEKHAYLLLGECRVLYDRCKSIAIEAMQAVPFAQSVNSRRQVQSPVLTIFRDVYLQIISSCLSSHDLHGAVQCVEPLLLLHRLEVDRAIHHQLAQAILPIIITQASIRPSVDQAQWLRNESGELLDRQDSCQEIQLFRMEVGQLAEAMVSKWAVDSGAILTCLLEMFASRMTAVLQQSARTEADVRQLEALLWVIVVMFQGCAAHGDSSADEQSASFSPASQMRQSSRKSHPAALWLPFISALGQQVELACSLSASVDILTHRYLTFWKRVPDYLVESGDKLGIEDLRATVVVAITLCCRSLGSSHLRMCASIALQAIVSTQLVSCLVSSEIQSVFACLLSTVSQTTPDLAFVTDSVYFPNVCRCLGTLMRGLSDGAEQEQLFSSTLTRLSQELSTRLNAVCLTFQTMSHAKPGDKDVRLSLTVASSSLQQLTVGLKNFLNSFQKDTTADGSEGNDLLSAPKTTASILCMMQQLSVQLLPAQIAFLQASSLLGEAVLPHLDVLLSSGMSLCAVQEVVFSLGLGGIDSIAFTTQLLDALSQQPFPYSGYPSLLRVLVREASTADAPQELLAVLHRCCKSLYQGCIKYLEVALRIKDVHFSEGLRSFLRETFRLHKQILVSSVHLLTAVTMGTSSIAGDSSDEGGSLLLDFLRLVSTVSSALHQLFPTPDSHTVELLRVTSIAWNTTFNGVSVASADEMRPLLISASECLVPSMLPDFIFYCDEKLLLVSSGMLEHMLCLLYRHQRLDATLPIVYSKIMEILAAAQTSPTVFPVCVRQVIAASGLDRFGRMIYNTLALHCHQQYGAVTDRVQLAKANTKMKLVLQRLGLFSRGSRKAPATDPLLIWESSDGAAK